MASRMVRAFAARRRRSKGFELVGHYTGAEARQDIGAILEAVEEEGLFAGIGGTDGMPLLKAEGLTGYEGPDISTTIAIDELRKSWRRWFNAIDAYDLAVGVTMNGKMLGVVYRNPENTGGVRSLRHHARVSTSQESLRQVVAECLGEIEGRSEGRIDESVGPVKRHLATIVRLLQEQHPRVAMS